MNEPENEKKVKDNNDLICFKIIIYFTLLISLIIFDK